MTDPENARKASELTDKIITRFGYTKTTSLYEAVYAGVVDAIRLGEMNILSILESLVEERKRRL